MTAKTFDRDMPVHEQLLRVSQTTKKGRKHNHQPSSRVIERKKAGQALWEVMLKRKREAYSAEVKAYWAGLRETHP
jgi:hypothetical protein